MQMAFFCLKESGRIERRKPPRIAILSDSEGSSSISKAAIQGEEDASFLSMTIVFNFATDNLISDLP